MSQKHPSVITLFCLVLLGAFLAVPDSFAHRVNIFAWVEGEMVRVQAGFSRKNPARQSAIIVLDGQDGVELLRGATDESGNFSFSLPPVAREHGLTIRVNAGEGHQNEWRLKPGECAAEQAAPQLAPQQALPRAQPQNQAQMLAARLDDGPTWRDIVGGLGWIFGLVGMGMAWRARVREKQRSGGR